MEGEETSTSKKLLSTDTIGAIFLLVVLIIAIIIIGLDRLNKIYNNGPSTSNGKKSSYALNIQEIVSEYSYSITGLEEDTEENKKQKQKLLVHRAKNFLKLYRKWEETKTSLTRLRAKNNVSEEKLLSHLNNIELFNTEKTEIENEKVSIYGDEYKFKIRTGVNDWKQVDILEYADYCSALENHIQSKEGTKAADGKDEGSNDTTNVPAESESSINKTVTNKNDDALALPTKIPINTNNPKNKGTYVVDIDQATADKNAMELIKEMEREQKKNRNKQQKNQKK